MLAAGQNYPNTCHPRDVWAGMEEDRKNYFFIDVRDQLMMGRLILDLLLIFAFFKAEPRPHKWCMENHVDFIEG